jgi:mRNA-degrading endonuclease toxin of MazEF toxin-antitoxin module
VPQVVRGGVYPYHSIRRGHVLVVSVDNLNRIGTVVAVEVVREPPPEDLRMLVTVQFGAGDPMTGASVLCWRLSYARADRLDLGASPGRATPETMERVVGAIRALIEP